MEQDTVSRLRRRSKSVDLLHMGYSMHVAAANGDKGRVKRCLKAGITRVFLGLSERRILLLPRLGYNFTTWGNTLLPCNV